MTESSHLKYGYSKFALTILFLLYMSQGLPYGFQKMALPIFLRDRGVSLTVIGFLGVLSLPWMLKALWAPLLDRFYFDKLGRRKSWIIPLQFLLIAAIALTSLVGISKNLSLLLVFIFLMNLFAATQDIAVDGFAIDNLKPHALGLGNTAQVVGYKTGMVLSGGILLGISQTIGWNGLFFSMVIITALPLLPLLFFKEKPVDRNRGAITYLREKPSLREIVRNAFNLIFAKDTRWAIVLIMTYKIGEELVQSMFNIFLYDNGVSRDQIGIWIGTYGMAASVAGSVLGGVLLIRLRVWIVLGVAIFARILPIGMQWWLTHTSITADYVIASTVLEHLAGGMLTTAMFTFMMSLVSKRVGATQYTLLASLEVLGKSPASWAAGIMAKNFGYSTLFFIGLMLSAFAMLPWYRCREINES